MNEPRDPTHEEMVADAAALEANQRAWLMTIARILALRSRESDPSERVQFAFDMLHIAACERAARILSSDLPRTI